MFDLQKDISLVYVVDCTFLKGNRKYIYSLYSCAFKVFWSVCKWVHQIASVCRAFYYNQG